MGRIKKGILGGFSGRVGNVIGGSWKGISYMRSEATSIANPRTTKQVEVRENFSVLGKLMSGALPVLRASDWRKAKGNSAFSKAMKVNYDNAVVEDAVDVSKLSFGVFSCPALVNLSGGFSVSEGTIQLRLIWQIDSEDPEQFETDKVYCVIAKESVNGGMDDEIIAIYYRQRDESDIEEDIAPVTSFTSGDKLYAFIGVASSDPYIKHAKRNEAVATATYTVTE